MWTAKNNDNCFNNNCLHSLKQDDSDYVGDFMMVTDFRFQWQNHYVADFVRYVGDFLNVFNRSPAS